MNQPFVLFTIASPHPSADTFTFSAKEKDSETDLNYFGSRYYNSDLSIWLSVDPMASKYPSFSPYTYCANNPVKLVDPNGEEIYVGENLYYRNGCLYNKSNGEIYAPDEDSFEAKALCSLNKLNGTSQGKELIQQFEGETSMDINIVDAIHRSDVKKGRSGVDHDTYNYSTGNFQSATIYWNPGGALLPTTDGFLANGTTDLGHEFSHVYDMAKGKSYLSGRYPLSSPLATEEWMATYRENNIRSELGLPYRTHYGTTINIWGERSPTGPCLLQNGKPYFPQHLLKSTIKSIMNRDEQIIPI